MQEGDTIISMCTGRQHRVRAPVTCDSLNVVYVVTCTLCGLQGVGECYSPKARLPTYLDALARDETNALRHERACAIHRHFMDLEHGAHDMELQLVDALPPGLLVQPSLIPALRKRMELRWIHRLNAQLNVKRFLHNSFTGDMAARLESSQ